MVRHENEKGSVNVSTNVYTDIVGTAAINCFGVKGMAARSVTDGVYHLLRKESASKGVRVRFFDDNSIAIDLHIIVTYGVNISAISKSIVNKVRYTVEEATGLTVKKVNVFVDGIQPE